MLHKKNIIGVRALTLDPQVPFAYTAMCGILHESNKNVKNNINNRRNSSIVCGNAINQIIHY